MALLRHGRPVSTGSPTAPIWPLAPVSASPSDRSVVGSIRHAVLVAIPRLRRRRGPCKSPRSLRMIPRSRPFVGLKRRHPAPNRDHIIIILQFFINLRQVIDEPLRSIIFCRARVTRRGGDGIVAPVWDRDVSGLQPTSAERATRCAPVPAGRRRRRSSQSVAVFGIIASRREQKPFRPPPGACATPAMVRSQRYSMWASRLRSARCRRAMTLNSRCCNCRRTFAFAVTASRPHTA